MVEGRTVRLPLRTVPALAAFLRRHLGWLAVHPAAEDAAADIDAVLRQALRALRSPTFSAPPTSTPTGRAA
jgi:hypothetical protein